MKRGRTQDWIPLHVDKWLWGSTRIELEPDERSVWTDFIVLASKDDGYIRANESTPYLPQLLAARLFIPEELLSRTVAKCLRFNKIQETEKGIYYITKWNEYQISDRWRRALNSGKAEVYSGKAEPRIEEKKGEKKKVEEKESASLVATIVSYLNKAAGKSFRPETASTVKVIKARLAEGRTLEEFRRVVDIKVGKWKGDEKMDAFLRPETLFGNKMEGYLNEGVFLSREQKEARVGMRKTPSDPLEAIQEKVGGIVAEEFWRTNSLESGGKGSTSKNLEELDRLWKSYRKAVATIAAAAGGADKAADPKSVYLAASQLLDETKEAKK